MFLVLRCGQNCSILVWPPQRPCDLHLTKTKIYLPKLPSMLNLKSIHPLGTVLQHRLSEKPDFAIPLYFHHRRTPSPGVCQGRHDELLYRQISTTTTVGWRNDFKIMSCNSKLGELVSQCQGCCLLLLL